MQGLLAHLRHVQGTVGDQSLLSDQYLLSTPPPSHRVLPARSPSPARPLQAGRSHPASRGGGFIRASRLDGRKVLTPSSTNTASISPPVPSRRLQPSSASRLQYVERCSLSPSSKTVQRANENCDKPNILVKKNKFLVTFFCLFWSLILINAISVFRRGRQQHPFLSALTRPHPTDLGWLPRSTSKSASFRNNSAPGAPESSTFTSHFFTLKTDGKREMLQAVSQETFRVLMD